MGERTAHPHGRARPGPLADTVLDRLSREGVRISGFSRPAVLFRPRVRGDAGCGRTGPNAPVLQHHRAVLAAPLSLAIRASCRGEAPVPLAAFQSVTSSANF